MTHADLAALPVAEKIQLMEALWDSLCDDPLQRLQSLPGMAKYWLNARCNWIRAAKN